MGDDRNDHNDEKYRNFLDDEQYEERHRYDERPLTLSLTQKLMGLLLVVVTSTLSVGGSYLAFKSTTDLRLAEAEKRIEKNDVRLTSQEAVGHPDHERRITKLETRMDDNDKTISEIKSQLGVVVAILQRIELKVDQKAGK